MASFKFHSQKFLIIIVAVLIKTSITIALGSNRNCPVSQFETANLISSSLSFEEQGDRSDDFVDFLRFDVIIWLKEMENFFCEVDWIHRTFEKATISILNLNANNVKKWIDESTEIPMMMTTNRRPLIHLFIGFHDIGLVKIVEFISQESFNNSADGTVNSNNVYLFVYPKIFSSKSSIKRNTTTLMNSIGKHLNVISNVYVLFYYRQNITNPPHRITDFATNHTNPEAQSNSRGIHALVQEAFSIRNTTIIHALEPTVKKVMAKVTNNASTTGETESIEIVPLTSHVFHYFQQRRKDWMGASVIGAGLDVPEYHLSTKFKDNLEEFESGFEVELYRYLRDALNFTEKAVKGKGYVSRGPNGTLNGYAKLINSGKADIGIGTTEFIDYRLKGKEAITLLLPTLVATQRAYFKQPPPRTVRNIFKNAFAKPVWLSMGGIWITIVVTLKFVIFIEQKLKIVYEKDEKISKDSILWATGVVCQQGWYTYPESICVKIVFFFGSLTGLVLYIAYSAALVSILSINNDPVKIFDDLMLHGFNFANEERTPTTYQTLKHLKSAKIINNFEKNIEIKDYIQTLLNSRLAIVSTDDSFYPVIMAEGKFNEEFICNSFDKTIITYSPVIKMSQFIKRGSPLRTYFNYVILSMGERGILGKLYTAYMKYSTVQCLTKKTVHHQNLGVGDVITAFVILILGYVISFVVLLMEKLYYCTTTKPK